MGWEILVRWFFINAVSKFRSKDIISKYVRNQGIEKEYKKSHAISKLVCFRGK